MSVNSKVVWTVIALVGAGALQAQQPTPQAGGAEPATRAAMPGMRMGAMGGMAMGVAAGFQPATLVNRREVLKLTPDQVSRLEALAQEVTAAREKAQADVQAHRRQLQDAWDAPEPNVQQLRAHAEAMAQAQHAAMLASLEAAGRAKAILSPEQRGRVAGWADAARMGPAPRMNRMGPSEGRPRRPGSGPRPMPRGQPG